MRFICISILALAASVHALADDPERPDVLFIAIDDLNDYVSVLNGHPDAQTPNFDRLAALAVNFTNAHTASPVCNSSRCAVMTGRHPFVTGVYENRQESDETVRRYGSLNQEFLANGYHVAGSGKIYHQFHFLESHWSETSRRFKWPRAAKKHKLGLVGGFAASAMLPDGVETQTGDFQSVSWITQRLKNPPGGKPQFLACGIYRPHVPWQVPEQYFNRFENSKLRLPPHLPSREDLADVPEYGKQLAYSGAGERLVQRFEDSSFHQIDEAGQWKDVVQTYLACVAYADAQLGRLLDAWEASPRRDNTLLVLWSDHGWHLGEKTHFRKATLWEEATRVPLLIRVPGVTQPGTTCDHVVSLIDLYPTLRDVCRLEASSELDGQSLRPLLTQPGAGAFRDHALTTFRDASISVRTRQHRLIHYADGSEEFYDHASDPNEQVNRINESAWSHSIQRLRAKLPERTADPTTYQKRKK